MFALLVIGCGATSWAQNGLERFEKEIKPQLALKALTYASGSPLGNSGFVLNDVVAVVPANAATGDKESTVKIEKVTVEEIDFDRLKSDAKPDDAPRFAKLKLEGMTGDDEMFAALRPYGVPNVPVDVALDYRLDPEAKVLDLRMLELNLRGQAKIALALVMDGVGNKSDMADAMDEGRLRTASLTLDDTGLLAKLVPGFAEEEGVKADDLVRTTLEALAGFAQSARPRNIEGARRGGLLHRRLEGAQGPAGAGAQARQDGSAVRSRQDHGAQRAFDRVRLHRQLCGHHGGRGQAGRARSKVTDPAQRRAKRAQRL